MEIYDCGRTRINERRRYYIFQFAKIYGGRRPDFVSRASGRVELIGGHTDYNEGFVIAAAINNSCWIAASKRTDTRY